MGQVTDELRRDIENTRTDMSGTLDAIGDRVMPSRIAQRKKNKVLQSVHSVGDGVSGAADTVKHTPEAVTDRAQGAPMAAGAVAFGLGFVLAAVFPPSEKEKELSGQVMDTLAPVKEQALQSAHEMADHLKQPVADAAEAVKGAATEGAHGVADTARSAAQTTKGRAAHSVESVTGNRPAT